MATAKTLVNKSRDVDMTEGNVFRHLIKFASPLLAGNLFQQLYNLADGIIVGQFIGTDAFAAVGATGSLSFLIIGSLVISSSALSRMR